MSSTLLTPDLRRILDELARRLGILERRVTSRVAASAAPASTGSSYVAVDAAYSLAPNALTGIVWQNVNEQTGSALSVNSGTIYINETGAYDVSAYVYTPVSWGNATQSFMRLQFSGSAMVLDCAGRGGQSIPAASWGWHATAGDSLNIAVSHNATANVSVTVTAYVRRVG